MNPNSWRRVLDGTAIGQGEESSALDAKLQSPQEDNDGAQYLARLKTFERTAGPSPGAAVPQTAGNQPSDSFQERRRYPRYKCEGSVEFRLANSDVRTWGTLTDNRTGLLCRDDGHLSGWQRRGYGGGSEWNTRAGSGRSAGLLPLLGNGNLVYGSCAAGKGASRSAGRDAIAGLSQNSGGRSNHGFCCSRT